MQQNKKRLTIRQKINYNKDTKELVSLNPIYYEKESGFADSFD